MKQPRILITFLLLMALTLSCRFTTPSPTITPDPNVPGDINPPGSEFNFRAAADYSAKLGDVGVLVMQDGKIVFEEYHNGNNENTATHIHSATKGFWGPAIAAMIEDGMIQGYDQKVSDILTEWKTTDKKDITIRQVMELTSGLKNDIAEIQGTEPDAPDLYYYAIHDVKLVTEPGTRFQYGPVNFYVMGALMDRVLKNSGSQYADPLDYLQKRLLDKVGVTYEKWIRDDAGNPHIPNGAYLTPRNFATWGQFVLQKGNWNGEQLVRKDLMEELFKPSSANPGFGLFLWLNQPGGQGAVPQMAAPPGSTAGFIYHDGYPDMVGIMGAGKNRMYIVPSLNLVIARQTLSDDDDGFDDHTFLKLLFSGFDAYQPAQGSFTPAMQDATWTDAARQRDVPVRIYAPDLKHGSGPFPAIVFSHGGGKSREAYTYLGTYWAERGYIVVFLTHPGSDRAVIEAQETQGLQALMAALAGVDEFHLRPEDVRFVIDKLLSDDPGSELLRGRVDAGRIGMAGQCLGATTALAMVGLRANLPDQKDATFTDPRIRAAVALSPQMGGGRADSPLHEKSWELIQVPTLVMTGSQDFNWMPAVKANPRLIQMPYDGLPPGDKYLAEIKDAEHNAFTDSVPYYPARERDPRHHVWIQQATTAFFDAYLKGDTGALDWLKNEVLEAETQGEIRQEQKADAGSGTENTPAGGVEPWRLRSGVDDANALGGGGPYAVGVVETLTLHDAARAKDLLLRVTYPEGDGMFPIILFSHCGDCKRADFELLVRHWASHGYIVLQMDHEPGARTRAQDMSFVLDSVDEIGHKAPAVEGKMDATRVGAGGHLVGAYAASMLVGMKEFQSGGAAKPDTFADPRVDAALLLSPQGRGQGLTENSWEDIVIPMLVAAGSETPSSRTSNPSEWRTDPYYFAKPGDKYLLWIEGMDNSYAGLWRGGVDPKPAAWILDVTTAFWDAYLKQDADARAWLQSGQLAAQAEGALKLESK
ncbi:MAG: beta-lactamase [Anaerolineaceae bacterium]|nr:MAG: beta-lactamase [Anaerolineaceae bacterium]